MNKRILWFRCILLCAPLGIAAGVILGVGWQDPVALFEAQNRGLLLLRLWRVLAGVLVGASLGAAGVVLQAVLRNPLAEPYVLGLSSGAGLGVAVSILLGWSSVTILDMPAAAFAGAVLSLLLVYLLARVGRVTSPHTLILAGVVWSSFCGSLLMFIVSQSDAAGMHAVMWWFLGDLQVFDARLILTVVIVNAAAFLVLLLKARDLNALLLGESMAGHVGLDAEPSKVVLLGLASLVAATAVSISGLIAFVGLMIPHAVRGLVGPDHRRLLPAAAAAGAAFLVLADGLGRILMFPTEIPVGVITALLGAPFFLILLRRRQKEVWGGMP